MAILQKWWSLSWFIGWCALCMCRTWRIEMQHIATLTTFELYWRWKTQRQILSGRELWQLMLISVYLNGCGAMLYCDANRLFVWDSTCVQEQHCKSSHFTAMSTISTPSVYTHYAGFLQPMKAGFSISAPSKSYARRTETFWYVGGTNSAFYWHVIESIHVDFKYDGNRTIYHSSTPNTLTAT